ncbi:MAG TPA: penicillin-binding protein 2 [Actinomycetota bacterium]|nr:penicillin-binding protein 2 [Actinomycetota bacterium]
MNPQIRRLFFVFAALFTAVIAMGTYWLWRAPDLEARQGNPNEVVRQLTTKRGLVYASDGKTILAENRRRKVQGRTWFLRRYPQRGLAAHVVGYSTIERSRIGIEESLNDYLTGSNANLSTLVDRVENTLRGLTQEGNHVVTTLDARAQRVAMQALAGQCGSVVAIQPSTGRVLAMASTPTYDPNLIERNFRRATQVAAPCEPTSPLLNRATQGPVFIPGSTFKIVTAAAALDSPRWSPESTFEDPGYCIEYGKRVFNYADQAGPHVYGTVDFVEAVENSVNSVFCDLGKAMGARKLIDYAKRFGFYDNPPLETPEEERSPSGLYSKGKLFDPKDANQVDPGRFAFGQERLLVTPLQMAMVAATVANGGVLMEPHVVDRIVSPERDVITKTKPDEIRRVMRAETAAALTPMMVQVVESGTGTAAQISGIEVAGKTGTAETGRSDENDTSFIAFAPADDPDVAIAVFLQNQDGTGGSTAAPIAKTVLETLLRRTT